MTEAEKQAKSWGLAKKLFVAWHSSRASCGWDEAWEAMDEWDRGYWWSVAAWVYDNFEERVA